MTWSIIVKDPHTDLVAIAIASRFFAVGALCPWAAGDAGGVCTQALVNPNLGPRGLALLREGMEAGDVRDMLVSADRGRAARQVHVLDLAGRAAAHTGEECIEWCGHVCGDGVSVAGNMLAGPEVIAETLAAYEANRRLPIVERLLTAMVAGEAAGGDKRGRQAAAILVQGRESYPRLSLRVDDHADPLAELERLYRVATQHFIPFSYAFPTPDQPYGITDRSVLDDIIAREAGKPLGVRPARAGGKSGKVT